MGGSILGTKAIHCFLKHKIKKSFLFLDNLDEIKIREMVYEKNLKNSLFIIVSKSGNTIETLTNINLLKKKLDSSNTILIVENNDNSINNLSRKIKTPIIEHKKYIGGRYSVLSEVGMIPAHLMGLKIDNFRKNLLDYFKDKKKKLLVESISKISEMYLSKQIKSIVFLSYSPQLLDFAYWYQQLLAESLGKKGKGLLPIVSIGPRDHHSLLQLYLDGPKDKMFYILSSKNLYNFKVGKNYLDKKMKFLKNKKLNKVILSQRNAFVETLRKKNMPFREIHVNNFSEEVTGELFSYFMLETAMIGKLINLNPFDQPSVESVKILTKKYLS
jgi:glucose-6-phosphate isomerase